MKNYGRYWYSGAMPNSSIASSPAPVGTWETHERFFNAPLCETLIFLGFFDGLFKVDI